jgi:trehalose 6-phosphate synthase/phosphatase
MHMAHRLIIASNRLPLSVHEEHDTLSLSRSNGGLATALSSLFDENSSVWVGWTSARRHLSQKELASLAIPPFISPINLTSSEVASYYDTFANGILWPLAHGIAPTATHTAATKHDIQKAVQLFADAIESIAKPDDLIWVHDYHLFLLPQELRRRGITNKIGFFLHTPFFPPDMLSRVPYITEIMTSLLAADVIGLQVERDVRRFRGALKAQNMALPPHTTVRSFPIGINFADFDSLNTSVKVQARVRAIQRQFKGQTIVYSLSRLDYTKGIITQLEAFEYFLSQQSNQENIVYRLNVAPSREAVPEYEELKEEIAKKVAAVNARFATTAWQPVQYTYENIDLHEMCAWYQAAAIHLNTPVADGMNLVAKEYIAARRRSGSVIISSTMGAAAQLTEAFIVPPGNPKATADALNQALSLSADEKAERWRALRHEVKNHQAADWAQDFLNTLRQ